LFAAVSGLNANGTNLSIIGNNIANTGTVGFKSSRANFADIVNASLGGASGASSSGIGVFLSGIQSNFTQGSLQTTNNALDLAVDGNGFFQVMDTSGGVFYTRAGQFNIDKNGDVVNPDGFLLQGYQADATGTITGTIASINLTTTTSPPKATVNIALSANLDSQATIVAGGFAIADPTGTSNFSTALTVFDSLGIAHVMSTYFTKTAANTWQWNQVANASEVSVIAAAASGANARVASGTITFTTNGALDTESATTYYNAAVGTGIDFLGASAAQAIATDFGTSITTDGGTGLDGTTQFGSVSALVNQSQDGYASGSLQSVSIATDGTVSGRFSNGQIRTLAQVALARFNNAQGLAKLGKNLLAEAGNSGSPIIGKPDSSGLGRVLSNSLELSNVDLGEEFINLIGAQRGFQANARVVTTADEILGELVNLKR
jgi:flagellar hook protein FlgE